MFEDVANPTTEEIRAWAETPASMYPMQDWDLILCSITENDGLYLELAGSDLPMADTFLRCLYIIFGDAVRTAWKTRSREQIERLVGYGFQSADPSVRKWAAAARGALDRPDLFKAEDWIFGGAAIDEDAV
jgi:hypothetical protein